MNPFAATFADYCCYAPLALAVERAMEAEAVIDAIKAQKPRLLLDIGSGDGVFFQFLRSRIPPSYAIGLDRSSSEARIAKSKGCYQSLVIASAQHLPFRPETINFIMSNSVLEHIPSVQKAFLQWGSVLSSKGTAWFAVPLAKFNNNLFGSRLFGNVYAKFFDKIYHHHNMWAKERWVEVCAEAKLSVVGSGNYHGKSLTLLHELFLPTFVLARIIKLCFRRWVLWPNLRRHFRPFYYQIARFFYVRDRSPGAIWIVLQHQQR